MDVKDFNIFLKMLAINLIILKTLNYLKDEKERERKEVRRERKKNKKDETNFLVGKNKEKNSIHANICKFEIRTLSSLL